MFLGSQHAELQAKNALRPFLPPWQPTSTIPLVPPLALAFLQEPSASQALAAALQAASGLGHDSAGRGGSMPAHPRPASSSSAGLVLEQDTRSSPMKGPLGVVLWHLPSLVSFSSALEFFSAVFLEAFSWAAARSALAFFWPASCMSFSNAASALAATLANFSAVAARDFLRAAASAAAFLA